MFKQLDNLPRSIKWTFVIIVVVITLTVNFSMTEYITSSLQYTIDKLQYAIDKILSDNEDYYLHNFKSTRNNRTVQLKLTLTKENATFRKNLMSFTNNRSDPAYVESDDITIFPASARVTARKIFHNKPLVLWATEMHMSPMKDLTKTLTPFGVKVRHLSLDFSRCAWHDCGSSSKLKVLNVGNAKDLTPSVIEAFVKAYKEDPDMREVDVAFCGHPASLCELYYPLNKSVMVLPSTRYDMFRFTVDKWNHMNDVFIKMAEKPWNIFGGNNLYDAKFLQYYTGIKIHHLPSMCDYTSAQYTMEIKNYLLLRRYDRGFNKIFFQNFTSACQEINCTVQLNMIPSFTYRSLSKYMAVVNVPYQISVMTLFELYRMNVPMFFPSPELLARWQVDHYIMWDRSHDGALFGKRPNASIIPPHPSQKDVPDPKDEYDYESTLYWMKLADFYQVLPHGIIYDSIPHLVYLLENIGDNTLKYISRRMEKYNIEFKKVLLTKWRDVLLELAKNSPNHPN